MKGTLTVDGMSCEHCVASIMNSLKEKNVKAEVDLNAKTVKVEFAESAISIEEIKETIEDLGYDVK